MASEFPVLRVLSDLNIGAGLLDHSGALIASNERLNACLGRLGVDGAQSLTEIFAKLPQSGRRLRRGDDFIHIVESDDGHLIVVHYVRRIQLFYGDEIGLLAVIEYDVHPVPKESTIRDLFQLSSAEANICLLVCRGYTVSRIARETNTTIGTVRAHLRNIFQKTHTSTQGGLAHILRRSSLLPSLGKDSQAPWIEV